MVVRIQDNAFDIGDELREFAAGHTDQGAVVSFTGLVRDSVGDLLHMELEHYPAMTKSALEAIDEQATRRWQLGASLIIHRFGKLVPGDPIMMVATAAPHRADAFLAAEFMMDFLKTDAPFWKKETSKKGENWVATARCDKDALRRW